MITMLAPDCASLSPGLCKIVSRRDTTSYSADTLARPHITLMSNQAVVPRRGTLTSNPSRRLGYVEYPNLVPRRGTRATGHDYFTFSYISV